MSLTKEQKEYYKQKYSKISHIETIMESDSPQIYHTCLNCGLLSDELSNQCECGSQNFKSEFKHNYLDKECD